MIKWIIIGLFILKNVFEAIIEHLDNTYIDKELPENVRDVYNKEEYENWKNYNNESSKVSDIENYLDMAVILLFLVFDVYARLFNGLGDMSEPLKYLCILSIVMCVTRLIDLPFSFYDTFKIEEKYGLNTRTKKLFFIDEIKGFILGIVVQYGTIMLVYALFKYLGNYAFLWATLVFIGISLVLALIIVPIMKIFNKFTPLEDGELKERLLELCGKYDVKIKKIVIKDASKRTTRANAFCTGYGKLKTISLDDNLVNNYSVDQILAVFAHEFAHAKEKHTVKSMPLGALNILMVFGALALVLNYQGIYTAFGFNEMNYLFALIILDWLIWPLTELTSVISNYFSRKHEYEADAFAAKEGYGEELISCLKKLSKESLSDINPHPAVVFLDYSHPTLSQRISAIRKVQAN